MDAFTRMNYFMGMNFFSLLASTLFLSSTCFAETLANGCEFNEWPDTNGNLTYFEVISKDNAGTPRTVYWLKKSEDGEYSNNGKYDKATSLIKSSPAITACEKKTLHLPTKEEFEALRNCLGRDNFEEKFPDIFGGRMDGENIFWTSSVLAEDPVDAFIFLGKFGNTDHASRHPAFKYKVRCVGRF